MLSWCSYCQRFLGETQPYTDLRLTHGICKPCVDNEIPETDAEMAPVERLVNFQRKLWKLGQSADAQGAIEHVRANLGHFNRPVDVLLGFVVPLINHSAERHEEFASNASEAIARLTEEVFLIARESMAASFVERKTQETDVVFAPVEGNHHALGAQILELWMKSEGIRTLCIPEAGSADRVVEVCKLHSPKVLGLSLAMKSQLGAARRVLQTLKRDWTGPLPLLLAGGMPIKLGEILPDELPEASLIRDHNQLFLTLKTHLSLSFIYDIKRRSKQTA